VRLICVKYRLRGEQISRAAIAAREIFPVLETGIFRLLACHCFTDC
jgi:hypothetical protein